jgi:hypothetical protein
MGRAPTRRQDHLGPASPHGVLTPPSPTRTFGFAPGMCSGAWEDLEGMLVTNRPAAALPPSHHLTGTACGRDPAVLISRRGGTDGFLGRGVSPRSRVPGNGGTADPWKSVWCSRALTPWREPVRCSRERVGSRAVPVVTPGEKGISARVRRPYLDRRGHKRVRHYFFPNKRSRAQHPRPCLAGCRQWFRISGFSQPASSSASARTGRPSKARSV